MDDSFFMKVALKEAQKAVVKREWPVGCVIVLNDKIISRAHNLSNLARHELEHAEMIALRKVDKLLRNNPQSATLYTTCEPCPMCVGACIVYKIKRVVSGADPEQSGALGLLLNLPMYYQQKKFALQTTRGILEEECFSIFVTNRPHKKKLS